MPAEPLAPESQAVGTTVVLMEQRPQGDLARGSYVWPAWGVVLLVLAAVALVLGNELSARRRRKVQK